MSDEKLNGLLKASLIKGIRKTYFHSDANKRTRCVKFPCDSPVTAGGKGHPRGWPPFLFGPFCLEKELAWRAFVITSAEGARDLLFVEGSYVADPFTTIDTGTFFPLLSIAP